MRAVVAVVAVLGGLCWIAARWVDALTWPGTVLLGVAVAGAGTGLVSRGPIWLRSIAGLGFVALAGSVVQVLIDNLPDATVMTVGGVLAIVIGVVVLARRPPSRGSHTR